MTDAAGQQKIRIRQRMRAFRKSLDREQQLIAARCLRRNLIGQHCFLRAKHIAFYQPADGEIDPGPLISHSLSAGKKCYLPCIRADFNFPRRRLLRFHAFDNRSV